MEEDSKKNLFPNHPIDSAELNFLECDLSICEKISLIFLIYDDIPVAEQLISLVSEAPETSHSVPSIGVLENWARRSGLSWRDKLVEGLLIIQALSHVKKMGHNLKPLNAQFLPRFALKSVFIHPMKKVLYMFCESLLKSEANTLIKAILKVCPTVVCGHLDFIYLEYFLLKLIRSKFIQLGSWENNYQNLEPADIEKFVEIINQLEFNSLSECLLRTEKRLNISFPKQTNSNEFTDHHSQNLPTFKLSIKSDPDAASTSKCQLERSDEEPKYEIDYSTDIGLFVIINQVKFENDSSPERVSSLNERQGSDKDVQTLKDTAISLGFSVKVYENLNRNQIMYTLKNISQNLVSKRNSLFVLCVLSHGAKGVVYASDGKEIEIEKIEEIFYISKCPILAGKPKIFLIQACQGLNHMKKFEESSLCVDGPPATIPEKADFLVFLATSPNFVAYRDTQDGSWFIQTFCDKINNYHKEFNFQNLCLAVNNEIANKSNTKSLGQMSGYYCHLRMSLILKKINAI